MKFKQVRPTADPPHSFDTFTTLDEFKTRTCNRCGQCCEKFVLPYSPLELLVGSGSGTHQRWTPKIIAWLRDLVPNDEPDPWGNQTYRCLRLAYDDDGHAICTTYDTRPEPCEVFPYVPLPDGRQLAHSIQGLDRCSWYVGLVKLKKPAPKVAAVA